MQGREEEEEASGYSYTVLQGGMKVWAGLHLQVGEDAVLLVSKRPSVHGEVFQAHLQEGHTNTVR